MRDNNLSMFSMKLEAVDGEDDGERLPDWDVDDDDSEQIDYAIHNVDHFSSLTGENVEVKIESVGSDNRIDNGDPNISIKIESVELIEVPEVTINAIKDEIDIGPTEMHRPDVTVESTFKKPKEESLCTEKKNRRKNKKPSLKNGEFSGLSTKEKLEEAISCVLCNKSFNYLNNYNRHMKEFHHGKSYKCERCKKSFKRQYSLSRHQRSGVRCLPLKELAYKCVCGKSFEHKSNINRHKLGYCEQRKANVGEYICDVCSKVFPNRVRLSVHFSTHKRKKI